MANVTAAIVVLAFLSGCVTAVVGVWVGRGQSPVTLVMYWAAATLVLQMLAACIAVVHARVADDHDVDVQPRTTEVEHRPEFHSRIGD